jgi:sterol desaturase/sphingolipid hydroxylase (fatty acid hydroxylase superfamily)
MEQYLHLFIISGVIFIVIILLFVLIFNNSKVQSVLSKFFKFVGRALSESNGTPSSVRLNQFFTAIILDICIAFGFIWVVRTSSLQSIIITYLVAIIGYLLTLAGFKVRQKNIEEKLMPYNISDPEKEERENK